MYVHTLKNERHESEYTQLLILYKIIVRCEQRDGPPRPSAHHVTGRLKNKHLGKELTYDVHVES